MELGPGTHVVSFSGGRSSAYLVYLMEAERQKGADVHFVFMDTGAEHPETYNFVRRLVTEWGIPLVCIRVAYNPELGRGNGYEVVPVESLGFDLKPWLGMVVKYGCPSIAAPFCTARMKTEPYKKYCDFVFGLDYTTWLGIRSDEPSRLKERPGVKYLADISGYSKQEILAWFGANSFDLGIPEHLGNCVFCIKKGLNKVALAAMDCPTLADSFIEVVEGEHVRTAGRKYGNKAMYRGFHRLSDIIRIYSDQDRDELYSRTRAAKAFDTGSCSESCEALTLEAETC